MGFRLHSLAAVSACLLLMTGCASIRLSELTSIGSAVTPVKVNFEELNSYAARSRTAYDTETVIRTKYPATIRINSPGKTDVRYFLEQNDKLRTQYVTVRGTASKKNFSEDMDVKIRQDRKTDIPVHDGFDKASQAIYADLKKYLKPGYKTYVTGHSLGGAIAALLTIYIIEDGGKIERVVTFGQPKFTTAAGVKRLDFLPITRVVDENDMVPMLPPEGAYEHVGQELILLEGPRYVFLPAHDASRISVGEFWRTLSFSDLSDHHMDNYLKRLSTKTETAVQVPYNKREMYVAQRTNTAGPNRNHASFSR